MQWFKKDAAAPKEIWDEPIEWPIGDIQAANKIREICRSAASSAEKIGGAADRSQKSNPKSNVMSARRKPLWKLP